jgi:hypothetical protein
MEPTLIGVTLVSLAMAASMSLVVWRMLREERRRSDARVALLVEMARPDEPGPDPSDGLPLWRDEPIVEHDQAGAEAAAADPRAIFATHEEPSPLGRRLAVAGVLALLLGGVISVAILVRGTGMEAATSPAAAVDAPARSLELISLRHTREADTMTISGLVQNPRGGALVRRVTAVAFLFDRDGGLVSSGRAPLDYTTLEPGDESPFVILVSGSQNVARYRIGFRADDGRVLAHVDRRP